MKGHPLNFCLFVVVLACGMYLLSASAEAAVDGIYRSTINQGLMSVYVQTYTTGSAVIILTPDAISRWYAFLYEDWKSGMTNPLDLTDSGHSLSMSFLSETQAEATLTPAGKNPVEYTFFKNSSAPHDFRIMDGIYKGTPTTSLYMQTYTTKAAILIFSPDARSWMVFVDTNWTDGIEVTDDLAGYGHSLSMTAVDADTFNAFIQLGDGGSLSYVLDRKFTAPDTVQLLAAGRTVSFDPLETDK